MERAFLLNKTARMADEVQKNQNGEKCKYGIKSDNYINPQQITERINDKLRGEKDEDVELWETLLRKARHEMPGASDEKLRALVYRDIQTMKHGKKEEVDPELTLKPNI